MNKIVGPRWYVSVNNKRGVLFGTASARETREEAAADAMQLYGKMYPEFTAGEDFWLDRVEEWGAYVNRTKK